MVMHGGLHHEPLGISQSKTAGGNVDAIICDQQCKKVRTVRMVEGAGTVVRSICLCDCLRSRMPSTTWRADSEVAMKRRG